MNAFLPLALALVVCLPATARQSSAPAAKSSRPGELSFDHVEYDAPGDGRLWARGKTYKASFGAEGATYIPFLGSDAPRNMPVRLRLATASLGGVPIELEPEAVWSRSGDTVVLDRGAVDVHYLMNTESVEQTFVLDALPREGELVVRVEVESELEFTQAGEGFRFASERGGVNYGAATVVDGAGRHLKLESLLADGQIAIRVPAEFLRKATVPVVVDPLITTYGVALGTLTLSGGDVAYDASAGYYLHAYVYDFSVIDRDVYAHAVDSNGVVVPGQGAYIDLTANRWEAIGIANNNSANNCMVVAEAHIGDQTQIWGRIRNVPGTSMGAQVQISPNSAYNCAEPSIGGEAMDDGSNLYCVAWRKIVAGNESHIRYRVMSNTGLQVGASLTLDDEPVNTKWKPSVSKSCGFGDAAERRWNIVWSRDDGPWDADIWGAQVGSQGAIVTPRFAVDTTSSLNVGPVASAPLDSPTGGKRDFLVVYRADMDGGIGIRARLFKDNKYQATFDVNGLEADVVGGDFQSGAQYNPTIGTDGTQFILSYVESGEPHSADVYACTLRHHGSVLIASEAHVLVSDREGGLAHPRMATQHDAGVRGSREVGLSIEEYAGMGVSNTVGAVYESPAQWGLLGNTYCEGEPNNTGAAANFRVYGSAHPADNRLVLDVDNLPTFATGQFILSTTAQNFPLGNGTLCLGQPLLRLGSTVGNSWLQGAVGFELDLTTLPGGTVLQPGQTWYFQYWYRDAGSTNFSNAEAVTFQ